MKSPSLLEGIRVIDLTSVVFGPYCTQILADLGADVIKVEPPEGDMFRYAGKPAVTRGMGACHMTLNRGKRSITLDLKREDDAAILRRLIATADVFIHNVRAKAIDKLGFGYDAVHALRPDIVYVHCVGFGSDGPYADYQAYDDVIQAASGVASLASRVDGDPRPRYVPSLIADKTSGLYAAYATMAAIIHRLRTNEGQRVEVPMFESFTQFALEEHLFERVFDPPTGAAGYPRQLDPARQPFPTRDGYISIVPYTETAFVRLFEIFGDTEIFADPRFADTGSRMKNVSILYARIAAHTPKRTTAEWMEVLHEAQIPAMPVRDLADIMNDPHLAAVDFFRRRTHPTEGDYFEMRAPVKFSAVEPATTRPAPLFGADREDVLRELELLEKQG